jgi:hypothetical protein
MVSLESDGKAVMGDSDSSSGDFEKERAWIPNSLFFQREL